MLITYESEAINARLHGQNIQYVIPRQTMLIELPIAVLKNSSNKDAANKFIRFVKSDAGTGALRPVRIPPGRSDRSAKKYADEVPVAARASSRSTTRHRRLAQRRQGVVRPEQGPDGQDRAGGRRTELWLAYADRHTHRRPSEGEGRCGPLPRFHHGVSLADRRRCRSRRSLWASRADGCAEFWACRRARQRPSRR